MSFHLRHAEVCGCGLYLETDNEEGTTFCGSAKRAKPFDTVAAAKRAADVRGGPWDVVEVSYVLRWFDGDVPDQYGSLGRMRASRRDATRYPTADAARASALLPSLLFGADGEGDTTGWKVRRLIRKVKP